jgi:hypothetical protein
VIPGLSIPFSPGEVRVYALIVNYQYNDGSQSFTHWQMGGSCFLPGGISWKAGGTRTEFVIDLQTHNGNDGSLTFRSAIGNINRSWEIKPSFNISLSGLGFIKFALKRMF